MELRPEYKQTEAGVIPEDWKVESLSHIAQLKSGYAFKSDTYDSTGEYKVITIANVQDGYMDAATCSRIVSIPPDVQPHQRLELRDILISMTGNVGRVCRVTEADCLLNQRVGKLIASDVDADFLFVLLSQRRFLLSMATKVKGGAQGNLSVSDITEFLFPIPCNEVEQRAIAAALSDTDALLRGLDGLIAKKRDLKQAAMQQLLTGEARLPGFREEWEVKRLGEIATFHKGKGLPKSALTPYGSEPCIHYGELFTQYRETIRDTVSRTMKVPGDFRSVANDVLMPTSDVTPRGLAKASCVVADGVVLGGDILVIRIDPARISGTFLSFVIRREEEQVLRLVTGSTVFHLYGADMKKFTFTLPQLAEQQAIVDVLSDMDAELSALVVRRDKTRALKQGMMQELLTGKTRLVPRKAANA